jgi:hypothetical protein
MNCNRLQPKQTFNRGNVIQARLAVLTLTFLAGATVPPALAFEAIKVPPTPPIITPPAGNVAFLLGHATGTQGYVCLPSGEGASWTVNSSRPQATLFVNFPGDASQQILTHFLSPDANPNQFAPNPLPFGSPTWQGSFNHLLVYPKYTRNPPLVHCAGRRLDAESPNEIWDTASARAEGTPIG